MLADRKERAILAALVLFGLVSKLLWLDRNELAHDEPFTVYMALRSWGDLFMALHAENNPPLFFVLMKAWVTFTPLDTVWLRLPSAMFSALALWPLFLLTRALAGLRTAVVASLMFTFSNYHYGFAHEVRAYALFTLLTVVCIWQLWRLSRSQRHALLLLGLANIGLVYTHFFGWLTLGVQIIAVMLVPEFRAARKGALLVLAVSLISYLPYAEIFMERLGTSVEKGTWLAAPVPEELYNMVWRWSNAPVIAVLHTVVIGAAMFRSRMKDTALQLGLLWAFVPLFGMFLLSYQVPVFLDRYLVYAAPGFCLATAAALAHLMRGSWSHVPATIAVCGMMFTFTPWRKGDRKPSQVVAQVNEWCKGECGYRVEPSWYWLNYLAAENIELLRSYRQGDTAGHASPGATRLALLDTINTEIVVDAGSHFEDPSRRWYQELLATHPKVDSVEADRKVWVYRFRR